MTARTPEMLAAELGYGRAQTYADEVARSMGPLLTPAEAAALLNMSTKTLAGHVRAGKLRYVLKGRRHKLFAPADLTAFVELLREESKPRPSTGRKTRRTGTTTSSSKVFDFMAARAKRTGKRPSK